MSKETEIAIYARIGDMSGLEECDARELQHQLETKFKNGTKCRVRMTQQGEKKEYCMTMKTAAESCPTTQALAQMEHNTPVNEEFFNGFKVAAERMLIKTRYIFDSKSVTLLFGDKQIVIPDVRYEVDVYTKEDGTVADWCKIDVEVDSILDYLEECYPEIKGFKLTIKINHLPFKPMERILASTTDIDEKAELSRIWEMFTQKVH